MVSLEEILSQVQEKNEQHQQLYSGSEQAVRDHLVNPVLRCLGWDIEDPSQALPNTQTGQGFADYALLIDGKTALIVEAKRQSVRLEDGLDQVLGYSVQRGAQYSLLTNGKEWRLYWSFRAGTQPEERLIWDVQPTPDNCDACNALSAIRRQGFEALSTTIESYAKETALAGRWAVFCTDHAVIAQALVPAFRLYAPESVKRWTHITLALSDYKSFVADQVTRHGIPPAKPGTEVPPAGDPTPPPLLPTGKRIIINGEAIEIKRQKDVLIRTAEWLVRQGKLTHSNVPVPWGRGKSYIAHSEPKHSDGRPFYSRAQVSDWLWLETSAGRKEQETNARRLLTHCGYDPNILVVEWDE